MIPNLLEFVALTGVCLLIVLNCSKRRFGGAANVAQFMIIKIIEPIGQSETAIRARLKDLLEKGGHHHFISDTRGLTDAIEPK